jgi:hypothetical protein
MPVWALQVLNIGFFVFHTALILFNVLGWLSRRWRKWNLVCLGLTALSWFLMGIWYGAGYCICTDWHYQVRHTMGVRGDPDNYVQLLVRSLTGWTPSDSLSRTVAGVCFGISLIASLVLNIIDWRRVRLESTAHPD